MKVVFLIPLLIFSFLFKQIEVFSNIINVPSDLPTIQEALNAANTGDTVLVQPGVYNESISWPEVHGIKLISAGDTTNTIISGDYESIIIYFPDYNYYDTTTVIDGFTITHGIRGVTLINANPKLCNLNITANKNTNSNAKGGGIFCNNSSPYLENVSITYNILESNEGWCFGAGMYCNTNSSPSLNNVLIAYNKMELSLIHI